MMMIEKEIFGNGDFIFLTERVTARWNGEPMRTMSLRPAAQHHRMGG